MDFKIRIATLDDVPAMQIVRTSVRENRLSDPSVVPDTDYASYVQSGSIWVAENAAGIAGFAALDMSAANVWALFVRPDCEGRGIGRKLHSNMLEFARERGIRHLTLQTQPGTRAARFYLEAGWVRAGGRSDGQDLFETTLAD